MMQIVQAADIVAFDADTNDTLIKYLWLNYLFEQLWNDSQAIHASRDSWISASKKASKFPSSFTPKTRNNQRAKNLNLLTVSCWDSAQF